MRAIPVLVALLAGALPLAVHAESLRCNGQSMQPGDSRLSVLHKCGEPLLKDAYCAPVYHVPSYQLVPPPLVGIVVPCQPVEEWLYDRGPGHLMATVRFQAGVVRSIDYGRQPR